MAQLVEVAITELTRPLHTEFVTALRRTQVGPFQASQMLTDEFLAPLNQAQNWTGLDALLLPMDYALSGLPRLSLDAAAVSRLRHGQTVLLTPALLQLLPVEPSDAIALYDEQQGFIGVGMQDGAELKVRRLLNTANR